MFVIGVYKVTVNKQHNDCAYFRESEDTMLLILKEIYSSMGISADNQIPQQTMRIERPCPSPKPFFLEQPSSSKQPNVPGMDPTLPISRNVNIGPPPTSGFVRKS